MEEGTSIISSLNKNLIFDAIFDIEGGFLTLKGKTKVNNVEFFNVANEDKNILLEGRNIEFSGIVGFYKNLVNERTKLAGVYMDKVELTVKKNAEANVENLYSVNQSNSQVNNEGKIYVNSIYSIPDQITININYPENYKYIY